MARISLDRNEGSIKRCTSDRVEYYVETFA